MIFHSTMLAGAYVIEIELKEDHRGFFGRYFCRQAFEEHGLNPNVMQANIGYSRLRGTLRGVHYQMPPHAEAKLVRCTVGAIFDVVLDLRPASPTFRKWLSTELRPEDPRMIYVPEGCGHGYLALKDHTEVMYQVSSPYAPGAEQGVRWNDPYFCIEWPDMETFIISEKDQSWSDWPQKGPE